MREFLAIEELVPHRPPMLLIDKVRASSEGQIECAARVAEDSIFARDGRVPSVVLMEYMAQAIAARNQLIAVQEGGPKKGMLLGCRKMTLHGPSIPVGADVIIRATVLRESGGVAIYSCEAISDGVLSAEAQLTVAVIEPSEGADE